MRFICASILDANASICARARTSEEAPEAGTGTGLGGTGGSTGRVSAGGSTGRVGAGTVASPEGLWFVLRSIPADASSVGVARAARAARARIRGEFFGRDIPLRPRGVERDGERALVASRGAGERAPNLRRRPRRRAPIHARFRPRSARASNSHLRRTLSHVQSAAERRTTVRRDEHVRRARAFAAPDSALARRKGDAKPHRGTSAPPPRRPSRGTAPPPRPPRVRPAGRLRGRRRRRARWTVRWTVPSPIPRPRPRRRSTRRTPPPPRRNGVRCARRSAERRAATPPPRAPPPPGPRETPEQARRSQSRSQSRSRSRSRSRWSQTRRRRRRRMRRGGRRALHASRRVAPARGAVRRVWW